MECVPCSTRHGQLAITERNVSLHTDARCARRKTMEDVHAQPGVRRVRRPDSQKLTNHQ